VNLHAPYAAGPERAVLKELANWASEQNDTAWVGLERLAFDSGYSRRAVWGALRVMTDDGVIVFAGGAGVDGAIRLVAGGRGVRGGFRLVMDASKWTLSAAAVASGIERAAWWRRFEERKKKGAYAAPYRRSETVHGVHRLSEETVHGVHRLSEETVHATAENGARDDTNGRSHLLYDPDLSKEGAKVKEIRDPRIGKMLGELGAAMDRRARSGV
jgi:hypothetical protein